MPKSDGMFRVFSHKCLGLTTQANLVSFECNQLDERGQLNLGEAEAGGKITSKAQNFATQSPKLDINIDRGRVNLTSEDDRVRKILEARATFSNPIAF